MHLFRENLQKDEGSFVFLVESLVDLWKILEVSGIKDERIMVSADRFGVGRGRLATFLLKLSG